MNYENICKARFLSRPNRFIAYVELGGKQETVHVKNTGRCRELLQEGAEVYLAEAGNSGRKTKYDLVAVRKGDKLVNMDSAAPNAVVKEWLEGGGLFQEIQSIRPETTYKGSRFDFYAEKEHEKIFIEVKGVTLENDGVVSFTDAPSERAVKHVRELIEAVREGYRAYVLFVIQMKGVSYFEPNDRTHPEFGKALREAAAAGVQVLAYDCKVWESGMEIQDAVEVRL